MPEAAARETKITTCQTISQPGSYELANNLTATGDCLVITADGVTIDLAGFSIVGSNTTGRGISGTGLASAVRNGSISGFDTAVDIGTFSIVEGLRVFHNLRGISATGIVKGNIASENFGGISATGTVTGNYVFSNAREGLVAGQGSTLIGNTVDNNETTGISVQCPSNLTDNTAVNNGFRPPGSPNLELIGDGCHNEDNVAP